MGTQRTKRNGPVPQRLILRFSLLFFALILAFSALLSTVVGRRFVNAPMERLLALLSEPFLALFGDIAVSGNHLLYNDFSAILVEECNGILPMYIYLSAVLAFPSGWQAKWRGILLGIPAIFLINLLRVISLMLLGAHRPDIFDQVHIYVWQAIIAAVTVALWAIWAEKFVRPLAATDG